MGRRDEDDDNALLGRYIAGDADAFVVFYRRHLAAVVGFFLRRTGDRELAADLTAEVFAAALLAAPRYRPGERPALAWVYGIAANKLANSRRQERVEDAARERLALEPLNLDDEDLARVEQLAAVAERSALLQAAVEALPADQRTAVLSHVVNEQDYAAIAADLSCSQLVVRQRVSRGLRTLRSQIKDNS
jgi:RNA polymerase sigma-70 factor (ECF subfamily)